MGNEKRSGTTVAGIFLASCFTLAAIGSPFFVFVVLKSLDTRGIDAVEIPQVMAPPVAGDTEQREAEDASSNSSLAPPVPPDQSEFPRRLMRASQKEVVPWYTDAESRPFLMLTRIAVISGAALFGALGATLSILSRRGSLLIGTQQLICLQLVGATFALILALIFAGGFISGTLFPTGLDSWFGVIYRHEQFAKLLVWSFIAGFSERTIPEILRKLTDRLSGEVAIKKEEDESRTDLHFSRDQNARAKAGE